MKKAIQIIGMMCMTLVLVTSVSSCRKNPQTVSTFNVGLSAIEGDNPFDDSKAYIDMVANVMKWYGNDDIMVYSIDADYTKSESQVFHGDASIEGATMAPFSGYHMPVGDVGLFAFYPASKASAQIAAGNRATFNVGAAQTHEKDLFASSAYAGRIFMDPRGYVGAATCDVIEPYASFNLMPIFGFINVRIKDTQTSDRRLKSVTITDSQKYLTGTMSVLIPALKSADLDAMKQLGVNYKSNGNIDTYLPAMNDKLHEIGYMAEGDGHSVTLNVEAANNGFGATINGSYKFFLMPLRPGALLGDFTLTLTFFGEDDPVVINVPANQKYISIPGYYTNVNIDLKNGGTVL